MKNKNYIALMILCGSLVCLGCSQDTVQFEWRQLESGTGEHLYGIHFIDTKRGWAVGTGGTVLSTVDGGISWASAAISRDVLTQVSFATPNNGWTVSIGQVHYTGSGGASWNLQHQARGTGKNPPGILDLHFVDTTHGWAVGGKGQYSKQKMAGAVGKVNGTCQINTYGVCILWIQHTAGLLGRMVKFCIPLMVETGGFNSEVTSSSRYSLSIL